MYGYTRGILKNVAIPFTALILAGYTFSRIASDFHLVPFSFPPIPVVVNFGLNFVRRFDRATSCILCTGDMQKLHLILRELLYYARLRAAVLFIGRACFLSLLHADVRRRRMNGERMCSPKLVSTVAIIRGPLRRYERYCIHPGVPAPSLDIQKIFNRNSRETDKRTSKRALFSFFKLFFFLNIANRLRSIRAPNIYCRSVFTKLIKINSYTKLK